MSEAVQQNKTTNEKVHNEQLASKTWRITFFRWPNLSLKISSCSWYSACDNLQDQKKKKKKQKRQLQINIQRDDIWYKREKKLTKASYASLSAPLALLLRLFCSRLGGGVWAMEGGLRLASSFLCLSISSRWELILSCCLEIDNTLAGKMDRAPPIVLSFMCCVSFEFSFFLSIFFFYSSAFFYHRSPTCPSSPSRSSIIPTQRIIWIIK